MKLSHSFFYRPTVTVARELLGCFIVREIGKKRIVGRIVETEAYVGPDDKANHASRGRTKRTEVMFGPAGHLYVYLIYGMWWCMNVVTERDGYPAAVLIRGIEVVDQRVLGPGRVCRALHVTGKMNGWDVTKGTTVWFEDCHCEEETPSLRSGQARQSRDRHGPSGLAMTVTKIKIAPRIGVAYAGSWAKKPWRFVLKKLTPG